VSAIPLLTAIAERDRDALTDMLAEDVVFHSPVQTYRGRDQVIHLLLTIGGILEAIEVTRPAGRSTFFATQVEEHPMDGVIDVDKDGDGRITEITLMLRPLAALQAAVARMARALADSG
jgi:hypothetical protein